MTILCSDKTERSPRTSLGGTRRVCGRCPHRRGDAACDVRLADGKSGRKSVCPRAWGPPSLVHTVIRFLDFPPFNPHDKRYGSRVLGSDRGRPHGGEQVQDDWAYRDLQRAEKGHEADHR
jgi:hypothetical protein